MAEVVLVKDEYGKLAGLGEAGGRAYARFLAAIKKMDHGDTLKFSFKLPRSLPFHRRHFVILTAVYKAQDQFTSEEAFRLWLQVGAGFADMVPGPYGKAFPLPRSISWESLEDAEFQEHHAAVIAFMRSTHATRFLWPHLSDLKADEMINTLLMEFS